MQRREVWGRAVIAACALTWMAPAAQAADPVVTTDHGQVRGVATDGGTQYRGIPFAAPPVGKLRWRPPQPPASWAGVRDATAFGPACPQGKSAMLRLEKSLEEDCLTLNVYVPPGARARRPVMVWIHGGSLLSGTGAQYDPSRLAAAGDVVVVTINYRLGPFGFLAHPDLSREADPASGVAGIQDQIAALRWTARNAEAFGGDRANVTIFGQSAGGMSVCQLLASPQAAGLFHRAIIMSAGCNGRTISRSQAEGFGKILAWRLGCRRRATQTACMRGRSSAAVMHAANATARDGAWPLTGYLWLPAYHTATLPRAPFEAIRTSAFNRVPVMLGSTSEETSPAVQAAISSGIALNRFTLGLLTSVMGTRRPTARFATYTPEVYGSPARAAVALTTDAIVSCPVLQVQDELSRSTPTYAYEFTDQTTPVFYDQRTAFPFGAYHSSDLLYLFDRRGLGNGETVTDAQQALADTMIGYWTAFARAGDPNGEHRPVWPTYDAAQRRWQRLDSAGVHTTDMFARDHRCDLWIPGVGGT